MFEKYVLEAKSKYKINRQFIILTVHVDRKNPRQSGSIANRIITPPVPIPDDERKLTQFFIFTLLCDASKGFMKALKAFIKPFERPQRSVKIKIQINFYFKIIF